MTKVKICGLTNLADAREALAAGADYLGFIFYPPSPRAITPESAAALIRSLREDQQHAGRVQPADRARLVGVFVNEAPETIAGVMARCGLDFAQLSGDEDPALLNAVDSPIRGRAYKAVRARDLDEALDAASRYAPAPSGDAALPRLLLDTPHASLYGGTGQTADWEVAAGVARRVPGVMLAGGLSLENVTLAVRVVRPFAVDVAGGVEAEPGRKDHARLRAFVAAVRAAH